MTVKIRIVPRIIRPRCELGADWESERIVLAQRGTKEIQWWKSGKSWQGQLEGTQSFKPSLIAIDYAESYSWKTLHEGGRLSKTVLRENGKLIEQFLGVTVGCELYKQLSIKKTILIDE